MAGTAAQIVLDALMRCILQKILRFHKAGKNLQARVPEHKARAQIVLAAAEKLISIQIQRDANENENHRIRLNTRGQLANPLRVKAAREYGLQVEISGSQSLLYGTQRPLAAAIGPGDGGTHRIAAADRVDDLRWFTGNWCQAVKFPLAA